MSSGAFKPCLADSSDEQLAARFQDGCAESFAELDRRLRPRLLHVLVRRLATREDAEDVVQQTLWRVVEKIHLYDRNQRLSPWVFTIALRLAAQHGRRKQLPINQVAERQLDLPCPTLGPEELLSRREERDQLWDVADRVLKPEQWTALWLFYGEEQSIKDVARSLGRTKTSVSVLLYRARRMLAPHLRIFVDAGRMTEQAPDGDQLPAALLVGQCGGIR